MADNAGPTKWKRPELKTQGSILYWETKALAHAPQIDSKPESDLEHEREYVTSDATKMFRVLGEERLPWGWVCRLYVRGPTGSSPVKGSKMETAWETSTASFIAAAHQEGQKGQWLITAAHNLLANVYEHDEDGILTGDRTALAPTDAIYIEVGFGDHKLGVWADKVSIMKGYYDKVANIHLDGAVIHIKDSSIPPEFWMKAPPTFILPTTSKTLSVPFFIPGFPGAINEYQDMQGFYITGRHVPPEGPVKSVTDFTEVAITPADSKGHIVLKFNDVPSPEGFSGGPLIIGSGNDRKVIAVLNTDGIGALLVEKDGPGVDIISLLEVLGGIIKIVKL